MSRLEAALRRASTGAADEPPSALDEPLPRQDERFDVEAWLAMGTPPEVSLVRQPPSPGYSTPPVDDVVDVEDEAPPEPRFRAFNPKYVEKLVVSPALAPSLREQYRRLGATLHHAQMETGLKLLMISSAVPEEGKTLTATNIALTLSESYQRRVLLIDADLRRPSLDAVFQVPGVFGLSEALTNIPERKVSVIEISRHLSLLPAGAPDSDPMGALTSERMRRLLKEAAAAFEWVIIDTPPVGILTDAKLLGSMVDAALLVVRANKTSAALVQRAVDALGRNRILGVVMNRVVLRNAVGADSYYGAYYYASARRA